MSRHSREPIELELVELSRTRSDHPHSLRSHSPEKKLEKVGSNQSSTHGRPNRERARQTIRKLWLTAFLPVIAFAYLAFCYVAATRLVPVRIWKIDQPSEHLYEIKAGVTTINIIVVAISLLPLKTLLDDIKSEEFFRTLHISDSGVPLKDVNTVSIPSTAFVQSVQAILKNRTSKYYAGAVLSGITAALISSLAPAALSVGLVSADSDVVAIQVGAIGIDSAFRFGSGLESTITNQVFNDKVGEAASMGWVQNVLGAEIAFLPTSSRYGVPVPLNIAPNASARYLTDVAIMDPICNWTVPSVPPVVYNDPSGTASVRFSLPNFGILIDMMESSLSLYWQQPKALNVAGGSSPSLLYVFNSTTLAPDTSGTTTWIITRCASCTEPNYASDQSRLDLSELPTEVYSFTVNGTNTTTSYTTQYSMLVCNPRVSIETREVVLDGSGKIEVLESTGLTRQGNLHFLQTNLLLGNDLLKYTSDSGPETEFDYMGRAAQVKMFFGSNLGNSTRTPVLKPQPIDKITEEFALAQRAALRTYLSGVLGTSYVPGRIQVDKLVFTSSLPHIIVSTILFSLVALFINLCYLRPNMEQFTLFSIAAVLSRSNVGAVCEDAKYAGHVQEGRASEDTALELIEDRQVYLTKSDGPGPSLSID